MCAATRVTQCIVSQLHSDTMHCCTLQSDLTFTHAQLPAGGPLMILSHFGRRGGPGRYDGNVQKDGDTATARDVAHGDEVQGVIHQGRMSLWI